MRPAACAILVALTGVSACHGPPVGGPLTTGTAGGGATGAAGTGAGGSGHGGSGGNASGTAGTGPLPRTLTVVPGTGSAGLGYLRMTAVENGIAYPVVLDLSTGILSMRVVVKAITLSNGAATTLSMEDEALSGLSDGGSPVALDATHAYWWSRTLGTGSLLRLRRAPKTGGAREDVVAFDDSVATAPGRPVVTATGGAYVYWAARGKGIFRCPTSGGCGAGPETVVTAADDIFTMLVRGDWLYWASATNGKVWRHGLTTPGDQMLDGGPTVGIAQTCDIAVSANDTELWSIQCLYPYEVRRVNITAMTGTTIANAPNETIDETAAGTLAMGVDTIYFIGSDHVFSVPRTTAAATPQTLAALRTPSGVVADAIIGLDDQYLYLQGSGNSNAGYVLRMAR